MTSNTKKFIIFAFIILLISATTSQILTTKVEAIAWFVLPAIFAVVGAGIGAAKASGGTCNLYTSPAGDSAELCESCQSNPVIKCTEYKCKSLGQQCQYLQKERECIHVARRDLTPPKIESCEARDGPTLKSCPVNFNELGCEITEAIPEFGLAAVRFTTDEFAQCRFSPREGVSFEASDKNSQWLRNALFSNEHFFGIDIGNVTEDLIKENCQGGEECIFNIRCRDQAEPPNTMNRDFFLKFNILEGPDLQPPIIVQTAVPSGVSIPVGRSEANFSMFVDDKSGSPACRSSRGRDKEFSQMEGNFTCNPQRNFEEQGYECTTKFTDLESRPESVFYFRCKDTAGNANQKGFQFIIKTSEPLSIESKQLPSGIVAFDKVEVKLTTNNEALCYYKIDQDKEVLFEQTNAVQHLTAIPTSNGNHNIKVRCIDDAGNEAGAEANFKTEFTRFPVIKKVYTDGSVLVIKVNQPATCSYSTTDRNFNFNDGKTMSSREGLTHTTLSADSDKATYHIKCKNEAEGSAPSPSYTIFP